MAVESLYREPEQAQEPQRWPALELHDVFKIYRTGAVETVALRGVDLEVEAGEMMAILGPSGCGKSTLLALAAGLDRVSAGDVRSDGESLVTRSEAELAFYRARRVGIVFQSDNLWPNLSAVENVGLSLTLAGAEDAPRRAERALAEMGLAQRAEHRAGALSGGEQQRVAIAAALAKRAPLILADEPTGELDSLTADRILGLLRDRADAGSAVLIVTHSSEVAATADREIRLLDGGIDS
jgi:putative ABC transport system ATP-binding protein